MISDIANLFGLFLNFVGGLLLVIFTSPPLDVTAGGLPVMRWTADATPEQQLANQRRYRLHRIGFNAGVILLTVGFFLQLVVAAWPMLKRIIC